MAFSFLCHFFPLSFLLPIVVSARSFETRCLSFTPQGHVNNSTLQVLSFVPKGTNLTFPDNDATCARPYQVVSADLCRVALSIPTSNRSSITYELWLPSTWTGRILATGNGGVDGCIRYEDLGYGTSNGFATYGSNNGHNGTTGISFYQNSDVVEDFAWRALHTCVTVGKTLIQHFYRRSFDKSYYIGCSLGGRQGIKSAQKFPKDFDGILAGSPAIDFNNLVSWRESFYTITGSSDSPNFISSALWSAIHTEILNQCDGIDGVTDGIITNPNLCYFNAKAMLCSEAKSSNCLNLIQVGMVEKIFSPFVDGDGNLIYPAMQPGSELMAVLRLYSGQPYPASLGWFKYVVYDPSWDPSTFTYKDALVAEALNPFDIRTWPILSDLSAFRNRRGKMINFHGGQDNQITSFNTERFYDRLLADAASSSNDLNDFARFFRVPGMFHCNSGPGAWVIGQQGPVAGAPLGIGFTSSVNILAALVEWVEEGVAPKSILGTKFVNDTVSLGIDLQRNHCLYPLNSTYVGVDPKLPSSWSCL